MATNILDMPALSPTMTEGTLSRWLKKEGARTCAQGGDVILNRDRQGHNGGRSGR